MSHHLNKFLVGVWLSESTGQIPECDFLEWGAEKYYANVSNIISAYLGFITRMHSKHCPLIEIYIYFFLL